MSRDTEPQVREHILASLHKVYQQLTEQGYPGPFIRNQSACVTNMVDRHIGTVVYHELQPILRMVNIEN